MACVISYCSKKFSFNFVNFYCYSCCLYTFALLSHPDEGWLVFLLDNADAANASVPVAQCYPGLIAAIERRLGRAGEVLS